VQDTFFVFGINPVVARDKNASPNFDKYQTFLSTHKAKITKLNLDPPPVSKMTEDGILKKFTIEESQGWTTNPFEEGQDVLIVCHIEPIFGPNYCSPELRLDHVYMLIMMLPIEPVVFEWPDPVTSATTSATTTPSNTQTRSPRSSCSRTSSCP
jgi:hypothetical protein